MAGESYLFVREVAYMLSWAELQPGMPGQLPGLGFLRRACKQRVIRLKLVRGKATRAACPGTKSTDMAFSHSLVQPSEITCMR
jgi:hypothetical protein